MAGNSYVSHKHKLIAIWSPKCACTAVVDWFFSINGFGDEQQQRKWLVENGYLYNYRQSMHLVHDLGYRAVQFTREPYGRAISAYLNKFYIYKNLPLVEFKQLEDFSQQFVNSYNSYKRLSNNVFPGLSFIEYLEFVEHLVSKRRVINHHWDTQLPRDVVKRIIPTYVVKQESFNEDLAIVNSAFGFDQYVPPKINQTVYPSGFIDSDGDLASRNSLELLEEKIFLRKNNLINTRTKLLIEGVYAEDFEFFDYAA